MWEFLLYSRLGLKEQLGRSCFRIGAKHCFDTLCDFFFFRCHKVRAGESLMKLVSDLKQFLILNDFPSVNEAINQRNQQLRSLQEECDKKLIALRDEISIDLYELEEEYYSSRYK